MAIQTEILVLVTIIANQMFLKASGQPKVVCEDADWCITFPEGTCEEVDFIRRSCPTSCGVCGNGPVYVLTDWSPWSVCSVNVGIGKSTRTRRCVDPSTNLDAPSFVSCSDGSNVASLESRACSLGSVSQQVTYVAQTIFRAITSSATSRTGVKKTCPGDFVSSDQSVRMFASPCERTNQQATQSQVLTPKSKRDILFVIDESDSVGDINFGIVKRLTQAIVSKAFCGDNDIGKDKTRVGVVSFDSRQHLHMDLKASYVKSDVLKRINNIKFNQSTAGFTCIGHSLQYAIRKVLTTAGGARPSDGNTEQVVILLSDGCAYCKSLGQRASDVKTIAEEFRRNGVTVIALLVGPHSNECSEAMKSLSDGSRCYQTFELKSWKEVDIAIRTIEASQCPNTWLPSQC